MLIRVYHYDGEQLLKVNEEPIESLTPADVANLMSQAYDAGVKQEGFIWDNRLNKPC